MTNREYNLEEDTKNIALDAEEAVDQSESWEESEEGLRNLADNPQALTERFEEGDHVVLDETQDQFDTSNASEYSESDIQVLEGLEAVRKRPGMYIGDTTLRGLHHLVYEIVANSVDEALAGRCSDIHLTIQKDGSIEVVDNGSGIPVGIHPKLQIPTVEVVHTVLHAGGKFGGGAYSVSGGLHGVGASVVNALSSWMDVYVKREGNIYKISFSKGKTTEPLQIIGSCDPEETGTRTVFMPDSEIFPDCQFDYKTMLTRYREMAFLNREVTIHLRDERDEEVVQKETLHYEGGIVSFVTYLNKNKTKLQEESHPLYFASRVENSFVEVAMEYTDSYVENIYSYANNIATPEGGTHLTGFKTAITKVLNEYAKKFGYIKQNDKPFQGEDCREGLTAIVSVKLPEPQFEGQTKTKLGNAEMKSMVESAILEKFPFFLEEHPKEAEIMMQKCIRSALSREAAKKAREITRRKNTFDSVALPGKLADCQENDPTYCEIFIVEGDSAGGTAKNGRERKYQAILPLWGKMLNVERATADKVYSNSKLQPIVMALGAGIGSEFEIEKLRYGKVIIMADADVDGSHIRTLLLTFFFRHMRPLVEQGHVFIACPPLFKVEQGNEAYYAYDESGVEEIKKEHGWENPKLQRYKGLGEMSAEQLWETTMNPETRKLVRVDLEDALSADETFTILMGEEVDPRREFIQENAKYALVDN